MDGLYVSAFVGGIKKKLSPTLAFETQFMEHSVFDQNCFSIFLLKLTTKVLKECFEQNRIECQQICMSNSKVEECFFLIPPTKAET